MFCKGQYIALNLQDNFFFSIYLDYSMLSVLQWEKEGETKTLQA